MGDDEDLEKLDEMIREEEKISPAKKVLVCPMCNSTDIVCYMGENWATSTGARTTDT